MKTNLVLLFIYIPFIMMAQNIVQKIEAKNNEIVSLTGNLSNGKKMQDLSWAWNSANACFVEVRKNKFTGNHVLYETEISAYSNMEIILIPDDLNANFSLYAYQIGINSNYIVPNLPNCIRCEVDYKWNRNWKGKTQNHTRTVKNLVAIKNPFKVIIGVVGADDLTEGSYTLTIKTSYKN